MDSNRLNQDQGIGTMSRSMLIVMAFTMISKITGFLRETVLASHYGISMVTDAFKTAQNLPCIVLTIIVIAISSTLIPVYSGRLKQGPEAASRFMRNLFTVGLVFSAVVLLLTALSMEWMVGIIMRGAEEPETVRLAVRLAQLMMPMGFFVFLARISSAYLQANFRFTIPALSLLFLNVTNIVSILLSRGDNIAYVAIGTVVGWALAFVAQIPSMRRTGFTYKPVFDLKEAGLREVMVLMVPVLIASAFDQMYLTFDQMVAYNGAVGDPTALDYANRLATMPSGVLLTTVATVLFPNLVRNVDSRERFAGNLSFGINLNILIAVPAMVGMILLSLPIVRLIYERGEFSAEGTRLTATLLACYSAGILGVGLREIGNRCFYAYKDTVVPTVVGVGVVLVNIGLNYALHSVFGAAGIAAATAVSSMVSGVTLLLMLHRKRKVVEIGRITRCLWKTALATAAMAAVLLGCYALLGLATAAGMQLLLRLGVTGVLGILTYAVLLRVLKVEEWVELTRMIKKRLARG